MAFLPAARTLARLMPSRPPRSCLAPGCPHYAVARGKCSLHLGTYGHSAHTRGYGGKRYDWWRMNVLQRHPWCVGYPAGQHAPSCNRLSQVADHIVPLPRPNWQDGDWSLENGQGLSIPCHNRKTANESQ
jgi:5-methylcytosine-specific restriction endonuclease McrA